MIFPQMALVRQSFDPQCIENVFGEVDRELDGLQLARYLKPGATVAVTAGSRGIANIDVITRAVIEKLKGLGVSPFLFPAMGSHGGATADGQVQLLSHFGINETSMGCPIRSTMEVVHLDDAGDGYPLYIDKYAHEADHIVVINRIKPHTKFEGRIESGLMKMMAIGMGKHIGAQYYHRAAVQLTFGRIVETVGREIISRCRILFGLGIVENAYDKTCRIRAFRPERIEEGEKELLAYAKSRMARLPFDDLDILVVDEIGKNISGTGMDTNVTGRNRDIVGTFTSTPRIKRIFVRDLTDQTDGNAVGIGFADFTTTRAVNKMDRHKTYINTLTAISPEKAAIPMYFDTDREALDACLNTIGNIPAEAARIVHIRNTMDLSQIAVSRALENEIVRSPRLALVTPWQPIAMDSQGNIFSPFQTIAH